MLLSPQRIRVEPVVLLTVACVSEDEINLRVLGDFLLGFWVGPCPFTGVLVRGEQTQTHTHAEDHTLTEAERARCRHSPGASGVPRSWGRQGGPSLRPCVGGHGPVTRAPVHVVTVTLHMSLCEEAPRGSAPSHVSGAPGGTRRPRQVSREELCQPRNLNRQHRIPGVRSIRKPQDPQGEGHRSALT